MPDSRLVTAPANGPASAPAIGPAIGPEQPAGRARPRRLRLAELPALDGDTRRKTVRRHGPSRDGLVAFSFSIGWPELAVDLLLPEAAFDAFCAAHQVQQLPPAASAGPGTAGAWQPPEPEPETDA